MSGAIACPSLTVVYDGASVVKNTIASVRDTGQACVVYHRAVEECFARFLRGRSCEQIERPQKDVRGEWRVRRVSGDFERIIGINAR